MHDKKANFVGDAKRGSLYTETTLSAQEFTELKRRILSDSARKISIDENIERLKKELDFLRRTSQKIL